MPSVDYAHIMVIPTHKPNMKKWFRVGGLLCSLVMVPIMLKYCYMNITCKNDSKSSMLCMS
jgi:hypothetical protein